MKYPLIGIAIATALLVGCGNKHSEDEGAMTPAPATPDARQEQQAPAAAAPATPEPDAGTAKAPAEPAASGTAAQAPATPATSP